MNAIINPMDLNALKTQYESASPFPFFKIDGFLDPGFASQVAEAYPTYETARNMGREFHALNEKHKVQVTDAASFPAPVKRLADFLSSQEFLRDLEYITGIQTLVADPELGGGGMHLSSRSGRLDVHVDFNHLIERQLFRRLNILLYLNKEWKKEWGGNIELWDKEVSKCHQSLEPILNRCVVFETSEISFHGVTPIGCPSGQVRKSFAAYYYTTSPPANWDGHSHSTLFRARPTETIRKTLLMPAQKLREGFSSKVHEAKSLVKKLIRD